MIERIGRDARIGVYWTVGLKIAHQGYHVVVVLIVARMLGPSVFGIMALGLAISAFVEQLTRLGLPAAVIRKRRLTEGQTNAAFTYCLTISVALAIVLVATAPSLATIFDVPDLVKLLPLLALLFPVSAYYYMSTALLKRQLRFRLFATMSFVADFVQSTMTLLLAVLGFGLWSLIIGRLAGSIIAAAVAATTTGWTPRMNWQFNHIRPMLRYASLEFVRGQIRYIESYVSYLIIGYYMVPGALGLLDRAQSISRMPIQAFQMQVSAVLFPSFSRLQNDKDRLRRAFVKSLASVSLLMAGPLVGLASISAVLVPVVLGVDWVPMVPALQILCVATVFRVLASTAQNLNVATSDYIRQTIVGGVSALVAVTGCLAGLPWGIVGVSAGMLVAAVTLFLLSGVISLCVLQRGPRLLVDCLTPAVLAVSLMSGTVWALRRLVLTDSTLLNLVLLTLVGAIVYTTCVLSMQHSVVRGIRRDVFSDISGMLGRNKATADENSH